MVQIEFIPKKSFSFQRFLSFFLDMKAYLLEW